jgi:hypothetical protein
MQFPTALRALNHRDYRLFFSGQLISLIGTWMQRVARSWLVLELTNSPFKLGLVNALQSAAMRAEGLPGPAQGTTVREDIVAGLHYAARTPLVALTLGLLSTGGLFVINHNVLVPLLARDVLHEGAHGFGLLMAAVGTGAIVGALAVATRGEGRPPLSLLLGTAGTAAGLTLLLAGIRNFWAAMLVLTLVGLSQIAFLASCNTTLQLVVLDRMRGRIMSLYAFVWVGVTPLGPLFIGTIADWFGVARRTPWEAGWHWPPFWVWAHCGGGRGPLQLIP